MRYASTILLAVLISGCSDSHPFSPGATDDPNKPFRNLTILVDVSGDPSTGPQQFGTFVDGTLFSNVNPNNETRFAVSNGKHTIALAPFLGLSGWCINTSPNSFTEGLSGDVITRIVFSIDCPALDGAGVLQLTVSAQGSTAQARVPLTLIRLNGSPVTRSISALANGVSVIDLPTGLYRVQLDATATCEPNYILAAMELSSRTIAVRSGGQSSFALSYPCPT